MNPDEPSPAASSLPPPRVVVVARDALARAGLALLVQSAEGAAVVAQAAGADELAALADTARPDVVLWDLGWDAPGADERLAEVARSPLPAALLVPEGADIPEALAAGARAVLPRSIEPSTLTAALRAAARGLLVLDPGLARTLLPPPERAPAPPAEDLTARESEVLQLLAAGLANKSIAARLGISEHTVKFHVNALLGKLGVQSRTEAVVRAARLGLVIL